MFPFDISHPVVGRASVEINKPVKLVFHFVGEKFFDNYPKWALEVSDFKPLTGTDIFVGAKAQQTRQEQGQKVESVLEVSEFEPPRKVTLKGVDAPFRNTYQFSDNGKQDLTELEFSFELLELELFMWPFEKLIRMAIEEGAENTVENIKNLLADEPNNLSTQGVKA
ncbi:SRPBCC family protein [Methyloglobulus sp.]|uniref:SRPBCC family protein n=1 Tax=Methyloglobulus sp. TaxID=2518622 RepID=UPI0039896BBB